MNKVLEEESIVEKENVGEIDETRNEIGEEEDK